MMTDKPPPYWEGSVSPDDRENCTSGSYSNDLFGTDCVPCSVPPHNPQDLPGESTKEVDTYNNMSSKAKLGGLDRNGRGPSAPHQDITGPTTKGIDWSLNRPTSDGPTYQPIYPGSSLHGSTPPTLLDEGRQTITAAPMDPFSRWKEQFNRHYPDSKLCRDTPSLMRVEIPKNRAFPVLGHATCPDCFDGGPHQLSTMNKKNGIFSVKKIPCQKCRKCFKLMYFVHGAEVTVREAPRVARPPPYHNMTTHRPHHHSTSANIEPRTVPGNVPLGHGWNHDDADYGWNPRDGSGHGWGD